MINSFPQVGDQAAAQVNSRHSEFRKACRRLEKLERRSLQLYVQLGDSHGVTRARRIRINIELDGLANRKNNLRILLAALSPKANRIGAIGLDFVAGEFKVV